MTVELRQEPSLRRVFLSGSNSAGGGAQGVLRVSCVAPNSSSGQYLTQSLQEAK